MKLFESLTIEHRKHKGRHHLLCFLLMILFEVFFIYSNYHNERGMKEGWMILFYNLPLMNTIFLPVLLSAFASRMMDIEHKGDMLKCLYTFSSEKSIFMTKLVYGLIHVLFLVGLQGGSLILMSKILDFPLKFPVSCLIFYLAATFLSCGLLFCLHLVLSYFFKNQALSLSVGLMGSFLGLFSAFLPPSIFQKMLPWSTFLNNLFISMEWHEETGDVIWALERLPLEAILISSVWILILIALGLWLLKKAGVEEGSLLAKRRSSGKGRSFGKRRESDMSFWVPVEFRKLKGSPSWFAFLLIPVFAAVIGTINYLANIDILNDGWYSLWTQHTLFLSYFFMPVIVGVFAGCVWRVDHNGTNMNLLLTHASPVRIVLGKFGACVFVTTLSMIWVGILYVISGCICHVEGSIPSYLLVWILYGTIGACSICAVQVFLSLVIRNFVLPIVLAFVGGIAGLGCIVKGIPQLLPYALFAQAMTENTCILNPVKFIGNAMVFIVVFLGAGVVYLERSDARTQE